MLKTPLFDAHVALGARMVDFAGWSMPIQYPSGIPQEHLAVREHVGIFDVSHMGEIRVRGPEALALLAWGTLNNPAKLRDGQGQYSLMANAAGELIDDLYVYRDTGEDYLVVANASNINAVVAQLQRLQQGGEGHAFAAEVLDESSAWGLVALQGPAAATTLDRLVAADLTTVRKNRFVHTHLGTLPLRVARTGYTGEDGFEIFMAPTDAAAVWAALLAAGALPCGLGARDTLRLEAGLPLFGHELHAHANPLCTPFAWVVKEKPAVGLTALRAAPCDEQLVGLVLDGRGIAREGYRLLDADGTPVGRVTSGTVSPLTRRSIAMGWLASDLTSAGARIAVEIRGQPVAATVTPPPFYPA